MTTSSIFTKTAGGIIEEALRDGRIIPVEQPVQAIDNKRGLDALNNVAKYWQTQAINLWKQEQAIIPLVVDQQRYLLGPATGDDEASDSDDFFNTTQEMDDESRDEKQDALEQWLRRVPDDPGGLLRRKFRYEANQRRRRGDYQYRQTEKIW